MTPRCDGLQPPVLWHIELSHYSEKVRWALDYKAIPHVRRAPVPGFHGPIAMALTRSGHRRLPVLVLEGRAIGDSTAIVAALEEHRPDPPLYPSDPAERARVLELEEYFDETLAPAVRRFNFHHSLDDTDVTIESLYASDPDARGARLLRATMPVARRVVRRDYKIDEARAGRAREDILSAMDRVEREVGPSGYLVGKSFTIADLAGAALLTPLLLPPERQYPPRRAVPAVNEMREELGQRDGGRWVHEMFRRHRGTSAEVSG